MKKILYFVAEDNFFCTHRMPLALAAKEKGAEIIVCTKVNLYGDVIKNAGFKLIPLKALSRSKFNIFNEIVVFRQLFSIFSKEKPTIVHNLAMKPSLYGSIVAVLTGVPKVVNTFTGLGFLFTHNDRKTLIIRKVVTTLFKLLFIKRGMTLIVQNQDDLKVCQTLNLIDLSRLVLIKGSGVDPDVFTYTPEKDASQGVQVAFVSRMLKDKGILELIKAIRLLKEKKVKAHFIFCGEVDPQNPTSATCEDLKSWQKEGLIEWRGQCNNIAEIYKNVHLAVLPSYREGVPKSLLEAASSGRAIVSTDVPGCREIVQHGVNGLLVPAKNSTLLAQALEQLIKDPNLRESMGKAGRRLVEDHFSIKRVLANTLVCYD